MSQDNEVCLCFHVSYRKIVNFVKIENPKRASQISLCGGAGTGCGWCRPFLQRIFEQQSKSKQVSQSEAQRESLPTHIHSKIPGDASPNEVIRTDISADFDWDSELYAKKRQNYLRQKQAPQ